MINLHIRRPTGRAKRLGLVMLMAVGIGMCCGDLPATLDEQPDGSSTAFLVTTVNAVSQDDETEQRDPLTATSPAPDQAIAHSALAHWWLNSLARDEINVTSGCTNCHQSTDLSVEDATRRAHFDLYGLPPEFTESAYHSQLTPLSAVELTVPDTLTRQLLELPQDSGIVVERLCPLYVQALGLLNENDVILEINGQPAHTPADFANVIRNRHASQPVTLTVRRAGDVVTLKLVDPADAATAERSKDERPIIGVQIAEAAPVVRAQLKLPESARVVIESVVPDSPAAKAGVTVGDFVLKVGDTDIADVSDLQRAVAESDGHELTLHILRGGEPLVIAVEPTPRRTVFPKSPANESANEPIRQFILDPAQYRYQMNGNRMVPADSVGAWVWNATGDDVTGSPEYGNIVTIDNLLLPRLNTNARAIQELFEEPTDAAANDASAIHAELKQLKEQMEALTNAVDRLRDAVAREPVDPPADQK